MPRNCFVIMPFSATETCTEEEWTDIFENILKPAVEGAGLDYECRRSQATRGNIIASIIRELNDAYVVIADLTDRNPNVFYELGVRHALTSRTIIITQNDFHVPFDLKSYAYHVYQWKTTGGKAELTRRIRELLAGIDQDPERSDNPVGDFLERTPQPVPITEPIPVAPTEVAATQSLAGPSSEGLNAASFARRMARDRNPGNAVNVVYRLTRRELLRTLSAAIVTMANRPAPQSINRQQIVSTAKNYIQEIEPLTQKVEEFVLTSIEESWEPGVRLGLRLTGDLITLSERQTVTNIRFVKGAPAFLGWRLLLLMGSKAIADDDFDIVRLVINEPIEVEEGGAQFTHLSLARRTRLFHPEMFLGYSDLPMNYLQTIWSEIDYLSQFFEDELEFHVSLSKFLILVQLADAGQNQGYPLYPVFNLIPQANRAMSSLISRMRADNIYFGDVSKALGTTSDNLRQTWSSRATRFNSAELGHEYFRSDRILLPERLSTDPTVTL